MHFMFGVDKTGALNGYIKIPHVTVADDLAFLTHSQPEMQFMLDRIFMWSQLYREE